MKYEVIIIIVITEVRQDHLSKSRLSELTSLFSFCQGPNVCGIGHKARLDKGLVITFVTFSTDDKVMREDTR